MLLRDQGKINFAYFVNMFMLCQVRAIKYLIKYMGKCNEIYENCNILSVPIWNIIYMVGKAINQNIYFGTHCQNIIYRESNKISEPLGSKFVKEN